MNREFITFEVNGQTFGIDIMKIREIRAWTPSTRLPHVPECVAGVINLRGTVLPVIDLAARLGWEKTEATPRHAIIVTQFGEQARGLIVDSVSDIVTVGRDELQQPKATSNDDIIPFLEGLVAIENQMVMILDLDSLNIADQLVEAA